MFFQLMYMINKFVFRTLTLIFDGFRNVLKLLTTLTFPLFFIFLNAPAFSQENSLPEKVTLQMCYDSLDANFPLVKQKQNLEEITRLKIQNLQTRYFPDLYLKAKATYQSEMTKVDLSKMEYPTPDIPKDQYGLSLEVNQVIYDGGNTKAAKAVTQENLKVELQKVVVDVYQFKKQLNQLYFTCLLLQENKAIIELVFQTLDNQRKVAQAAVTQGMLNPSELDQLDAERLKMEQQLYELESGRIQAMSALSELTGMTFSSDITLEMPAFKSQTTNESYRPEQILFNQQSELLNASLEMTAKKRMPTVGAFVNAGYGRPGYNMFSDSFHGYYMVGAQAQWKIWDWKQTRREKEQLNQQKEIINDNRDAFNTNLTIAKTQNQVQTETLDKLMVKDEEIIKLQERITNRAASQLENGTITSAEYIRQLNADKQARINRKVHQIQKNQLQADYLFTIGAL